MTRRPIHNMQSGLIYMVQGQTPKTHMIYVGLGKERGKVNRMIKIKIQLLKLRKPNKSTIVARKFSQDYGNKINTHGDMDV